MLYNDQDVWLNKETSVLAHCRRSAALTTERSGWREIGEDEEERREGREGRDGTWARGNQEEEVTANPSLCLDSWKWDDELICLQSDGDTSTKMELSVRSRTHTHIHKYTYTRAHAHDGADAVGPPQSTACMSYMQTGPDSKIKQCAAMEIAPFLCCFLWLFSIFFHLH